MIQSALENVCVVRPLFRDPEDEEAHLVQQLLERIAAFDAAGAKKDPPVPPSTEIERHPKQLASILKRMNYQIEGATSEWEQWRDFRRSHNADGITSDSVKALVDAGLAEWKGTDKEGRPCLIITGRRLTEAVPRVPALFRQFIIFLAEAGLRTVLDLQTKFDQEGGDASPMERSNASSDSASAVPPGQIVVIYDRRGLLFANIDINLYRDCREVISEVRRFYMDRLHCFYILSMSWGHWAMYYLFLKPLLGLTGNANKMLAVDEEEDLLAYFPPSQIPLLAPFFSGKTVTFTAPDHSGVLQGGAGGGFPTSLQPNATILGNSSSVPVPFMMTGGMSAVEPNAIPPSTR